jgi:syntaxin 16
VEEAELVAAERAAEIAAVCTSIEQLSGLMRDLNALVMDQGTMIDRVDANMVQVLDRTTAGVAQLVVAQKHQQSTSKCSCVCMVVLGVLTAVFLVVLVLRKM